MLLANRKWLWTSLLITVMVIVVLGGCSSSKNDKKGETGTGTTTETGDGKSAETKETAAEPPTKIRFFYGNSGVPHYEGVDPNNNRFIDIINRRANVILDVEVPQYQDFETKYNLMMASGNLPDLVHTWFLAQAEKSGDEGAFIDLKEYYDKSPTVQKVITPEMMELAKSPSGKYYRIPMAWNTAPQGSGLVIRLDLLEKYNNGEYPKNVDDLVSILRKIKQANPKSIPMSNRVVGNTTLTYGGNTFYNLLGANPYSNRIQGDKVIPNFGTPEYMKATQIMRDLYAEGILDKEFATNDLDKWNNTMWADNDTLLEYDSADQVVPGAASIANGTMTNMPKGAKIAFAPPLEVDPIVSNPLYTESFHELPIIGHGLYIPSSSKNKDAAWRTIEALASDEFYDALWYGFEGEHYTVENGEKKFNFEKLADPSIQWKLHLNFVFGFVAGQEVTKQKNMITLGEEFGNLVYDSLKPYQAQADKNGISPLQFVEPLLSDQHKTKSAERTEFISKVTVQAIMGRITMQQLEQEFASYMKKYGSMYDELTQIWHEQKGTMAEKGVKVLEW